jgi:hypothetical protein
MTRAAIAATAEALTLGQAPPCYVCLEIARASTRLIRAIRRLDHRMRFQKALEGAPPFCIAHTREVTEGGMAPVFRRIQVRHLSRLRDQLAQEELRGQDSAGAIQQVLETFGGERWNRRSEKAVRVEAPESDESQNEERDLEHWDADQQLNHLGKLESEVAALRYRNSVLERENRAFRLARAAVDGLREDLQREREALRSSSRRTPETK